MNIFEEIANMVATKEQENALEYYRLFRSKFQEDKDKCPIDWAREFDYAHRIKNAYEAKCPLAIIVFEAIERKLSNI